ncbi:MAG: putative membrane protein [Candidatus Deianiraeaceae bacterium]|jgi:uncharacterized membrane protein
MVMFIYFMTKKSRFLTLAVSGLSIAITSHIALAAKSPKMEKCYGVVKTSKNDCASAKKGGHSCAGAAKIDGDKSEWVILPKGVCKRLVNGSLVGEK